MSWLLNRLQHGELNYPGLFGGQIQLTSLRLIALLLTPHSHTPQVKVSWRGGECPSLFSLSCILLLRRLLHLHLLLRVCVFKSPALHPTPSTKTPRRALRITSLSTLTPLGLARRIFSLALSASPLKLLLLLHHHLLLLLPFSSGRGKLMVNS